MTNGFSEENLTEIARHSGIHTISLRNLLKSENMQKIQRVFKKHSFIQACTILKRAHNVDFVRRSKQARALLVKLKSFKLDYRIKY